MIGERAIGPFIGATIRLMPEGFALAGTHDGDRPQMLYNIALGPVRA